MFQFRLFGEEFRMEYDPLFDYIQLYQKNEQGVFNPYNKAEGSPTIYFAGKSKPEAIQMLLDALGNVFTHLKAEFAGGDNPPDPDEPQNVKDFIGWIIDNKLSVDETGFKVDY